MKPPSLSARVFITTLTVIYFLTNIAFAHKPEANFWQERQKTVHSVQRIADRDNADQGRDYALSATRYPLSPQLASLPAGLQLPSPSSALLTTVSQGLKSPLPSAVAKGDSPEGWRGEGKGEGDISSIVKALPALYGSVRNISRPSTSPLRPSPHPLSQRERGTGNRSISWGEGGKVVIHIQDVHMNQEAQQNIGKALQELINSGKVGLVALEGAFDPIDLTAFRNFPHQDTIHKVADYLLRENKISGPIHTFLTCPQENKGSESRHPGEGRDPGKRNKGLDSGFRRNDDTLPPFIGIDDPSHYQANVEAYKRSAPHLKEYKDRLAALEEKLEQEKSRILNPELLSFDQQVQAYRQGKLKVGEYAQILLSPRPRQGERVGVRGVYDVSPSIKVFLQALDLESSLNFSQVESERTQLLSQLVKKLDKPQTSELLSYSVAYRLGSIKHTDFYQYLSGLCQKAGLDLSQYPSMNIYIQYVLLSDKLNPEKLIADMKSLEDLGYISLSKTPQEKNLIAESKHLYLTGKLLDFSLTPEEWGEYKTSKAAGREEGIERRGSVRKDQLMRLEEGEQDRRQSAHGRGELSDPKYKHPVGEPSFSLGDFNFQLIFELSDFILQPGFNLSDLGLYLGHPFFEPLFSHFQNHLLRLTFYFINHLDQRFSTFVRQSFSQYFRHGNNSHNASFEGEGKDHSLPQIRVSDHSLPHPILLPHREKEFLGSLSSFEAFYREAEARDGAMVRNLLAYSSPRKPSPGLRPPRQTPGESPLETSPGTGRGGSKVIVLVTGGFHSHGMDEKLQEAGFTTISFVPKITHVEPEGRNPEQGEGSAGSKYLSVFTQEKTPLEKLFQGEKLFMSPPPISDRMEAQILTVVAHQHKVGQQAPPVFRTDIGLIGLPSDLVPKTQIISQDAGSLDMRFGPVDVTTKFDPNNGIKEARFKKIGIAVTIPQVVEQKISSWWKDKELWFTLAASILVLLDLPSWTHAGENTVRLFGITGGALTVGLFVLALFWWAMVNWAFPQGGRPRINLQEIKAWLENLYEKTQEEWGKMVLRVMVDNLRCISHSQFEEKLSAVATAVNREISHFPSYAVLWDSDPHKSKRWVYSLIANRLQKTPSIAVYSTASGYKALSSAPLIVIFDDISISGMDLHNKLARLLHLYPTTHLMIAIPYMSSRMNRELSELRRGGWPIKLLEDAQGNPLYEVLPTLQDLVGTGQFGSLQAVVAADGILAFFDHNIPDQFSFPQIIKGWIERKIGAVDKPYQRKGTSYYEQEERDFSQGAVVTHEKALLAFRIPGKMPDGPSAESSSPESPPPVNSLLGLIAEARGWPHPERWMRRGYAVEIGVFLGATWLFHYMDWGQRSIFTVGTTPVTVFSLAALGFFAFYALIHVWVGALSVGGARGQPISKLGLRFFSHFVGFLPYLLPALWFNPGTFLAASLFHIGLDELLNYLKHAPGHARVVTNPSVRHRTFSQEKAFGVSAISAIAASLFLMAMVHGSMDREAASNIGVAMSAPFFFGPLRRSLKRSSWSVWPHSDGTPNERQPGHGGEPGTAQVPTTFEKETSLMPGLYKTVLTQMAEERPLTKLKNIPVEQLRKVLTALRSSLAHIKGMPDNLLDSTLIRVKAALFGPPFEFEKPEPTLPEQTKETVKKPYGIKDLPKLFDPNNPDDLNLLQLLFILMDGTTGPKKWPAISARFKDIGQRLSMPDIMELREQLATELLKRVVTVELETRAQELINSLLKYRRHPTWKEFISLLPNDENTLRWAQSCNEVIQTKDIVSRDRIRNELMQKVQNDPASIHTILTIRTTVRSLYPNPSYRLALYRRLDRLLSDLIAAGVRGAPRPGPSPPAPGAPSSFFPDSKSYTRYGAWTESYGIVGLFIYGVLQLFGVSLQTHEFFVVGIGVAALFVALHFAWDALRYVIWGTPFPQRKPFPMLIGAFLMHLVGTLAIRHLPVSFGENALYFLSESLGLSLQISPALWTYLAGHALTHLIWNNLFPGSALAASGTPPGEGTSSSGTSSHIPIELTPKTKLKGHPGTIYAMAFRPDSKVLASSGQEDKIYLWNRATGQLQKTINPHCSSFSLAFSPDGESISSFDGQKGTLWNLRSQTSRVQLRLDPVPKEFHVSPDDFDAEAFDPFPLSGFGVSPDGHLIAYIKDDKTLWIKDVSGRKKIIGWNIVRLAFSSHGKLLAGATASGQIIVWDLNTLHRVKTLPGSGEKVSGLAFSPDGKMIAAAESHRRILLWDIKTGKPGLWLPVQAFEALAFSPDGKILATGGTLIRFWDVATGELLANLKGHTETEWISLLAFSPDGLTLASAGGGKEIYLWDLSPVVLKRWPATSLDPHRTHENLLLREFERLKPGKKNLTPKEFEERVNVAAFLHIFDRLVPPEVAADLDKLPTLGAQQTALLACYLYRIHALPFETLGQLQKEIASLDRWENDSIRRKGEDYRIALELHSAIPEQGRQALRSHAIQRLLNLAMNVKGNRNKQGELRVATIFEEGGLEFQSLPFSGWEALDEFLEVWEAIARAESFKAYGPFWKPLTKIWVHFNINGRLEKPGLETLLYKWLLINARFEREMNLRSRSHPNDYGLWDVRPPRKSKLGKRYRTEVTGEMWVGYGENEQAALKNYRKNLLRVLDEGAHAYLIGKDNGESWIKQIADDAIRRKERFTNFMDYFYRLCLRGSITPPAPGASLTLPSTVRATEDFLFQHPHLKEWAVWLSGASRLSTEKEQMERVAQRITSPWVSEVYDFFDGERWIDAHDPQTPDQYNKRLEGLHLMWVGMCLMSLSLGMGGALLFGLFSHQSPLFYFFMPLIGLITFALSYYSGWAFQKIKSGRHPYLEAFPPLVLFLIALSLPAVLGGSVAHTIYNWKHPEAPLTKKDRDWKELDYYLGRLRSKTIADDELIQVIDQIGLGLSERSLGKQWHPSRQKIVDALMERPEVKNSEAWRQTNSVLRAHLLYALSFIAFDRPFARGKFFEALSQEPIDEFVADSAMKGLLGFLNRPGAYTVKEHLSSLPNLLFPLLSQQGTMHETLSLIETLLGYSLPTPGDRPHFEPFLPVNAFSADPWVEVLRDIVKNPISYSSAAFLLRLLGQEVPASRGFKDLPSGVSLSQQEMARLFQEIKRSELPSSLLGRLFSEGKQLVFINGHPDMLDSFGILRDALTLRRQKPSLLTHIALPLPPSAEGRLDDFISNGKMAQHDMLNDGFQGLNSPR